eukprot:237120_1
MSTSEEDTNRKRKNKRSLKAMQNNDEELEASSLSGSHKKRKLNENDSTIERKKSNIDEIMVQLGIFAKKSNLIFGGEGEDKLNPVIVSKHNCNVIPVRNNIISAIQESKCLISTIDTITNMITDFIVSNDKQFTTEQFVILLCNNHNPLNSFGTTQDVMRRWYLNGQLIIDIDKRRQDLTIENLKQVSGLKNYYDEEGWEDKVNWDFVHFMNNNLLNVSIITIPADSYSLQESKYNVDYKGKYPDNPWNFIHNHYIVGRTDNGDIIGYKTQIVWT